MKNLSTPLLLLPLAALLLVGCQTTARLPSLTPGKRRPSVIVRTFETAKKSYDRYKFAAAARQFQEFLDTYPDDPLAAPALYYVASSHKELGDHNKAEELYTQLIDRYKTGVWPDVASYDLQTMRSARE